ncbi:DUF2182 domain-containing protein [Jannaschia sp. Os4]|uniref:DUF2182 domain-containing protein n=1 Tax=Jannaschia sp. Os4 TaxID=2807617 RepID=UPI00193A9809|nr:DUF2182 domain-containing protein [Jannaschia sp. Os4]MBM2577967.1 DUF2182 domain-containing protein [Jannaschia sp. Os4]
MERLSHLRRGHWWALYGAILGAWALLWASVPEGSAGGAAWLADVCRAVAADAGPGGVLALWVLMGAAMMLPTAVPTLAAYDMVPGARDGWKVVAGYSAVWIGFAGVATAVQLSLSSLGALDAAWLGAALLLLAAGYQVSALKAACLSKCRQPVTFLMSHWDEGPWRMGLRLGAVCLGCCWALMALGLVGGLMSLGFMALATVLMTAEKLSAGPMLSRGMAVACVAGAGWMIGGIA